MMLPSPSRRQFLKYSSGYALAQLPLFKDSLAQTPSADVSINPKDWNELAHHLKGPLIRPGERDFAKLAATWNLRYSNIRTPSGIARCTSPEDVRVCLQWAQAHKLPLVARSGGHSYAGYSTTPGLMIELKLMDSLSFDDATGKTTVGGGARNQTLYDALPGKHSSVTHGRCSYVGVGGLVLGGGIGFNMRLHGLLIDQLLETDLMTASGKLLRCNTQENADLFWASRGGGGGNFGINTSFTFQTFPVGKVTVFDITWTEKLDELLPSAMEVLAAMPDRLGCKLSVNQKAGKPMKIQLLGQLLGWPGEVRKLLAPLYRLASPSDELVKAVDYWDAQKKHLGEDGSPEYSHERSRYAFHALGRAACRTILKHMRKWPGTSYQSTWKLFLMGGAVSKMSSTATAYSHRAATSVTSVELNWTEQDSPKQMALNDLWLARFHDAMAEFTSDECYQNFIDDSQRNYLRAYYGKNLERLVAIKRSVDPANVFHHPQSIPVRL